MSLSIKDKSKDGFERVVYAEDEKFNFNSIIAIHNTKRGPALGGCRYFNYPDLNKQEEDVLKLAEAMTYKNSLAELPFGGGKATIHAKINKKDAYSLFGEVLNKLNGTYITAGDMGTVDEDLRGFREYSDYVCNPIGSDSGLSTAIGVYYSMLGCLEFKYGQESLKNKNIFIKGYGKTGSRIASLCKKDGANIEISDLEHKKDLIEKDGYKFCNRLRDTSFKKIDIYSPCAGGGDLNKEFMNFANNKISIITGSANNQLANKEIENELNNKNILYCPDYCANAGGVIILGSRISIKEDLEPDDKIVDDLLKKIKSRTKFILEKSDKEMVLASKIANEIALDGLK